MKESVHVKTSLVIFSHLILGEYNFQYQMYDRFRLKIIRPKSKHKIADVMKAVSEESEKSDHVDVLFWLDISGKDLLDFDEALQNMDKVHCHYVSDDFTPIRIKLK